MEVKMSEHSYFETLMESLKKPGACFVVLNPRDYVAIVLGKMTKETYEPENHQEMLRIGHMGTYLGSQGTGPFRAIYVRQEVAQGSVVCGLDGENPLESIKTPLMRDLE